MPGLEALVRHAVLVAAVLALLGAGWRLAAHALAAPTTGRYVAPDGLVAALAAATFAVTAMVLWALVLGLVGLGSSPVVLTLAAFATFVVADRLTPDPPPVGVRRWWRATPRRERSLVTAALFALAAWTLWALRTPHVGTDGLTYHLSLVASWVSTGDAGAATPLLEGVPVGNYPITHEVALFWSSAIAGSWAPAIVAAPVLVALLAAATWTGLRALGADALAAALATAALVALPLVAGQVNAVGTDLPALTWFAVAGTLALHARLFPFAILAAGLAVGTKTTSVVLVGAVVLLAAWTQRRELRTMTRPLAVALVAALGLAAVWPLRNLLDHGSPLWPFQAWPGGDPVPPAFVAIDDAFIDHPRAMLDGRVDDYLRTLGGGALLLAGALVLPLVARDRRALGAAGVTLVALLAWVNAPYTGIATSTELAVGATRYLLPCLGAAVVAVALSARGAVRPAALAVLGAALAWSLVRDAGIGFPLTPSAGLLLAAALAGIAFAYVVPAFALRLALVPLAAWLVLAFAAPGVVERHERAGLADAPLLAALDADPRFSGSGGREMAMAPATVALAAGAHLQHTLQLVPADESCAAVRARLDRGWLVLQASPRTRTYTRIRACLGDLAPVHRDVVYELYRR